MLIDLNSKPRRGKKNNVRKYEEDQFRSAMVIYAP
jgi:hypothetical protein